MAILGETTTSVSLTHAAMTLAIDARRKFNGGLPINSNDWPPMVGGYSAAAYKQALEQADENEQKLLKEEYSKMEQKLKMRDEGAINRLYKHYGFVLS